MLSPASSGCVTVQPGDRIGIYFDNVGAIPYVFATVALYTTYIQQLPNKPYDEIFTVNQQQKFDTLVFPYQFQVTAYIGKKKQIGFNKGLHGIYEWYI